MMQPPPEASVPSWILQTVKASDVTLPPASTATTAPSTPIAVDTAGTQPPHLPTLPVDVSPKTAARTRWLGWVSAPPTDYATSSRKPVKVSVYPLNYRMHTSPAISSTTHAVSVWNSCDSVQRVSFKKGTEQISTAVRTDAVKHVDEVPDWIKQASAGVPPAVTTVNAGSVLQSNTIVNADLTGNPDWIQSIPVGHQTSVSMPAIRPEHVRSDSLIIAVQRSSSDHDLTSPRSEVKESKSTKQGQQRPVSAPPKSFGWFRSRAKESAAPDATTTTMTVLQVSHILCKHVAL